MTAARRLGLDAAVTACTEFGTELAVVVTRYDCILGADGRVQRVHQEDMCQALAVFPRDKYEFDCGPRAARLVATLEQPGLPETRSDNADRFIAALVYNYLIGAPDAHAKKLLGPPRRGPGQVRAPVRRRERAAVRPPRP